ncbi:SRPBCC family protein [Nesterenkonia sp. HG001]|uniref:SRPBCC family protein n=1 Tax=Nesterenkonia sp. HG001 TaxID=2983207 RepID=UPI002AC7CE72|nr:SRPBCC family protein [Nesterenkonia sp. HG001]MDZ5078650.1 SRPBCC family protein [Nesterenkonia sp. HG001]
MPITSVDKDLEALTMTVTADFPVPLRRLWDAYADPRQLERFWGPREWPATFTRHDMFPGGRSAYVMTGPDGETSAGWWEFLAVTPPHSFEVLDGFAGPDGEPDRNMPTMRMAFSFEESADGSRLLVRTFFNSADELEELLTMGMEEGLRSALSQVDEVLHDPLPHSPARSQLLNDTQVRISRVIAGSVEDVWQAHRSPELLRRWMLGPDGWTMPVCEVAEDPGDAYRFEWESDEGEQRFGFTGEILESQPPHREVTTERMIGVEGSSTTNELTLTPVDAGTLLNVVITYPDKELRDTVLGTGMVDGMETSYARLESEVLPHP